jgi:hypothetical protein
MHLLFAVGAGSGSPACFSHPNSGSCSSNSPGAQVFAILIVAAIVVLAILALLYKRTSSTGRPRGPLMRAVNAIVTALSRTGWRP